MHFLPPARSASLFLLVLVMPVFAGAFSSGPPDRRTWCGNEGSVSPICDGNACDSCASCHSTFGGPNTGQGSVSLQMLPDEWEPGRSYMLTILLEDPGNPDFERGGFELSAHLPGDGWCNAGTLETVAATGTQISTTADGLQWLKHSTPQIQSGGMAMWDLMWTAPATGAGEIAFAFCANAANGAGSSGDRIYCDEILLAEAAPAEDCSNGTDDDGDEDVDCADSDCACELAACPEADCDQDQTANDVDCAPRDETVWAAPPEVRNIRVAKRAQDEGSLEVAVRWSSPDAGPATGFDLLAGGADGFGDQPEPFAQAQCLRDDWGPPAPVDMAGETCGNNTDDDGDGLGDCFDPECAGVGACDPPQVRGAFTVGRQGSGTSVQWFLVRAQNACGTGTYGDGGVSPDPRDFADTGGPAGGCP